MLGKKIVYVEVLKILLALFIELSIELLIFVIILYLTRYLGENVGLLIAKALFPSLPLIPFFCLPSEEQMSLMADRIYRQKFVEKLVVYIGVIGIIGLLYNIIWEDILPEIIFYLFGIYIFDMEFEIFFDVILQMPEWFLPVCNIDIDILTPAMSIIIFISVSIVVILYAWKENINIKNK